VVENLELVLDANQPGKENSGEISPTENISLSMLSE